MIRKATAEDIPSVTAIYEAILDAEERGQACTGWLRGVYPTRRTAEDALAVGSLFVCEDGGAIVAAAKLDQTQVPEYAGCPWSYAAPDSEILVLHTLVVHPACSHRGYGREFVAFYERYAAMQGCSVLRMDTNERNTAARRLYAGLGYREAGVVDCVFNGIPSVRLVCLEKHIPLL